MHGGRANDDRDFAASFADAGLDGFARPEAMPKSLERCQTCRGELFAEPYVAAQSLASLEWRNEDLLTIYGGCSPPADKVERILGFVPIARTGA